MPFTALHLWCSKWKRNHGVNLRAHPGKVCRSRCADGGQGITALPG